MDIFNADERQIVCVENDDRSPFPGFENAHLLTVGEKYTVVDVEVHSWHTLVTLREFPDEQFNSVLFEEIEDVESLYPKVTVHPWDSRSVEDVLGDIIERKKS